MGEGGCVLTDKPLLRTLVESFRDWGRDCWCAPGKDNTCGKRFDWQLGELPCGYDHKYTYSHIGYNLKLTDMQAAVGVAQLRKAGRLHRGAARATSTRCAKACATWKSSSSCRKPPPAPSRAGSAFPIAVRAGAPFTRNQVIARSGEAQNRHPSAVRRQPDAPAGVPRRARIASSAPLANTDFVMNQVFWIGVYPGITPVMMDYILEAFHAIPAC